jgi:hypothetical protein
MRRGYHSSHEKRLISGMLPDDRRMVVRVTPAAAPDVAQLPLTSSLTKDAPRKAK